MISSIFYCSLDFNRENFGNTSDDSDMLGGHLKDALASNDGRFYLRFLDRRRFSEVAASEDWSAILKTKTERCNKMENKIFLGEVI